MKGDPEQRAILLGASCRCGVWVQQIDGAYRSNEIERFVWWVR